MPRGAGGFGHVDYPTSAATGPVLRSLHLRVLPGEDIVIGFATSAGQVRWTGMPGVPQNERFSSLHCWRPVE